MNVVKGHEIYGIGARFDLGTHLSWHIPFSCFSYKLQVNKTLILHDAKWVNCITMNLKVQCIESFMLK